jgi:hypothetical protein
MLQAKNIFSVLKGNKMQIQHKRTHNRQDIFSRSSGPNKNLQRDLSNHTDVLNFILAEVGMPAEYRPFLDAVLGASEARRGWIELSDYHLGQRLSARAENAKKASIEKRAQRGRSQLVKWQIEAGIELLIIEIGGRKRNENLPKGYEDLPTRYQVDKLLDIWVEAVQLLERSIDRDRNPVRAKKSAAKKVAPKLKGSPVKSYRGSQRPTDADSERFRCQRAAVTFASKSLILTKRAGHDPKYMLDEIMSMLDEEYKKLLRGEIGEQEIGEQYEGAWWNKNAEGDENTDLGHPTE